MVSHEDVSASAVTLYKGGGGEIEGSEQHDRVETGADNMVCSVHLDH